MRNSYLSLLMLAGLAIIAFSEAFAQSQLPGPSGEWVLVESESPTEVCRSKQLQISKVEPNLVAFNFGERPGTAFRTTSTYNDVIIVSNLERGTIENYYFTVSKSSERVLTVWIFERGMANFANGFGCTYRRK